MIKIFNEEELRKFENENLTYIKQVHGYYSDVFFSYQIKKRAIEIKFRIYYHNDGIEIYHYCGTKKKEVIEETVKIANYLMDVLKSDKKERLFYALRMKKARIEPRYYNQILEERVEKITDFYFKKSHLPIFFLMNFLYALFPKAAIATGGAFMFILIIQIVLFGLKYTTSQGDPKYLEEAKMQLLSIGKHILVQFASLMIAKIFWL